MSIVDHRMDDGKFDLENILERFDPSVKGKFERCADISWCASEEIASVPCAENSTGKSARRRHSAVDDVCRKSKFARKVARNLESLKKKISKHKTSRREMATSPIADRPIDEQIRRGSNTPANSRPCSISMTMDQIEKSRFKNSDIDGPTSCTISCGGS